MPTARFLLIIVLVVAAAALTIGLGYAFRSGLFGPGLLLALVAVALVARFWTRAR